MAVVNLKAQVATIADFKPTLTEMADDGAIVVQPDTVVITKGSICALTLAAPRAGEQDGVTLKIVSSTAYAHTIIHSSPGFNGGGNPMSMVRLGGAIGDNVTVIAYDGTWYIKSSVNATVVAEPRYKSVSSTVTVTDTPTVSRGA